MLQNQITVICFLILTFKKWSLSKEQSIKFQFKIKTHILFAICEMLSLDNTKNIDMLLTFSAEVGDLLCSVMCGGSFVRRSHRRPSLIKVKFQFIPVY